MFSLALDILVAILLVATICYAVILNRKLESLRKGKEEMERLAASFGEATLRADENIGRLKETATQLQSGIGKAQSLHDDLTFLIGRGDKVADHLEDMVRYARKESGYKPGNSIPQKTDSTGTGSQTADKVGTTKDRLADKQANAGSDAERELLKALRAVR